MQSQFGGRHKQGVEVEYQVMNVTDLRLKVRPAYQNAVDIDWVLCYVLLMSVAAHIGYHMKLLRMHLYMCIWFTTMNHVDHHLLQACHLQCKAARNARLFHTYPPFSETFVSQTTESCGTCICT